MSKTLICFTASFPYGVRETYFESELQYLASAFETVIIVPKYNPYKESANRNMPENVRVTSPVLSNNKIARFFKGLFTSGPIGFYIEDFRENRVYSSSGKLKSWFRSLIMHKIIYKKMQSLLREIDDEVVVYSYWADAPMLATSLLEKHKKVVRMHRWDFYIEEHAGYLPVRRHIYQSSDVLLPISMDIQNRLIQNYKIDKTKIHLSYLGVSASLSEKEIFDKEDDGVLRIASCSRVDPIKRVELIANAVLEIGKQRRIEWHHFGDGVNFNALKEKMSSVSENITVYLHGWADQKELYNFYKEHYVTWFINVSRHEGVPVSIMEAISFGIPSIATNVGATDELINDNNGFLVEEDISIDKLTELILSYESSEYFEKRKRAYQTWKKRFNADLNYKMLVEKLKE